MSDIELVVGAPMAATLGFAYGMGPCLISCAPFLAPVFLASDGGIRESWKIILPLSLGRLSSYALLGAIAGEAGRFVKVNVASGAIHGVVGSAALLIGIALLIPRRRQVETTQWQPLRRMDIARADEQRKTLLPWGLYMMGVGMTLSPCAPLGVVLFSAGVSGTAANGLLLGLSFGLGAIVIPALAYGIGMAYLSSQLREKLLEWQPHIARLSALLLVMVGISNLAR